MSNYCPDCSEVLAGREKCKKCGWFAGKKSETKKSDTRCAFSNGNERCPLAGSLGNNLMGKGPWLCSFHFKTQDDPLLSANVLDDIIKTNPFKDYKDWRDVLVDDRLMALGPMDKAAKIDTLNFMREVIGGLSR